MTSIDAGAFGATGKLVTHGDFIRIAADAPAFASFDSWLTQSVEWAAARAGFEWPDAFRVGAIQAFSFRTNGASSPLLVGAFGPSSDQAGRQFPICVAAPISASQDLAGASHLLPLILEGVWQEASELLIGLQNAPAAVASRLGMARPRLTPFSEAAAEYPTWISELTADELWPLIFGANFADHPEQTLRFIAEAVRPLRGVEHSTSPLSLRLPLGNAGGAAVCFWLHVVRTLMRWQTTIPSFFWSHDGASGQLMLHLGAPPASTLAELWLPTDRRDEFCDLRKPLSAAVVNALAPLPPAVHAELGANRPVAALLHALERMA